MVITRIYAGLANQMFQYAAGRRLAHVLGVELKLDISSFAYDKLRRYSLGAFNIQENIASLGEVTALKKVTIPQRLLAKLRHRAPGPGPRHIAEKHFHFDPEVLTLHDGVYLEGYWQSEKYFADIAGIIRREFVVKSPQSGKTKELAEMIASKESVSLHIRRGDYVADLKENKIHGVLSLDYYYRCIEKLTRIVRNPYFIVFSDEPQWAISNLSLSYPITFVEHDSNELSRDIEDLRLMSQCKHHIIANSSFSWWGAWLNPRNAKMVIAPKQWFTKEGLMSMRVDDLLPNSWIVL